MVATLALALTLQAPKNVPADAEVIYALMPAVTASTAADGSKVALHQSIHAVTATLAKKEIAFESLSLFKNTTANEGTVNVTIAFESWRSGFGEAIKVEALWSDQPVEPTSPVKVVQALPEKGQVGTYALTYALPVKKMATHSLKLKYKLPVGVSGVDREERLVAYRVKNIGQAAALEQFRMAVKFNRDTVFAPIESQPNWGWQVGAEGAYLKLDGRPSDKDAVLAFRYYPAGF